MIYHHPPTDEIRKTFIDPDKVQRVNHPPTSDCSCCVQRRKDPDHKQFKVLALIVFLVTATLVGLNAFQRENVEQTDNMTMHLPAGTPVHAVAMQPNLGPGATQATETVFPTRSTIERTPFYYVPTNGQMNNNPYQQSVRPGEMTPPCMAMPVHDGKGGFRIKRIVGR